MFEIEKDVPPPTTGRDNARYEFERLQPGDSIFVPAVLATLTTTADRARWAVKKYRRTHAPESRWRTAVKTTGIRIWRVG